MGFFLLFYGFVVISLNFLRWNLPKFSQHIASCGVRILNTKKAGLVLAFFFDFLQILVFYRCEKTAVTDFPEKRVPTKGKYLPPVWQILRNFTEVTARKFTVSFAFCARVDVIKYRKTLKSSLERAQITWAFVLCARAIGSRLNFTRNHAFCSK